MSRIVDEPYFTYSAYNCLLYTSLEQMSDLASVKESLYELTANMEHQSTLWHATPFGMVFLSRILKKALQKSGQNPVAHFLAGELLDFFACILQCFHDGDEMEHAEPLPLFSDLLREEYLWSEEYDEEEDEICMFPGASVPSKS